MPLHVVATPLGNLGDLAPRARELLARADVVYAEDTRVTRRLLAALGVGAPPLRSAPAEGEGARTAELLATLAADKDVVLVSDAGTPGVSDPGAVLVAAAHAAGHAVRAVAGPSALAAALSVSGFPTPPAHFLGFPPRKPGALDAFVVEASRLPGVLVLYESGRRTGDLITALAARLPDREAVLCRELTKLHEEVVRAPLAALPVGEQRGEVVLVVGPGAPVAEAPLALGGEGLKDVAAVLAARWGVSKRDAYQELVALETARRR